MSIKSKIFLRDSRPVLWNGLNEAGEKRRSPWKESQLGNNKEIDVATTDCTVILFCI